MADSGIHSAHVLVLSCGGERVKDVHCRVVDEISNTQATTRAQHDLDVSLRPLAHSTSTSETAEPEEVSALI